MSLNFPDPNVQTTYTYGATTWEWTGIAWEVAANGLVGPTGPTGPSGGPTGPTGATGLAGPTGPTGASTLDGLTDVSAATPSTGDFLKYNGSSWIGDDIDLGTDTVGNYVSTITAGTNLSISAGSGTGEGSTPTLATSTTPSFSTITSTVADGTPPFTVASTTAVTNLNADLLDGQHGSFYAPTGMMTPFAGSSSPTGWLLCDGSLKSQTTYSALFALIGTTYGPTVGSDFRLPDLRGRVPVGLGNMGGSDAGRLSVTNTLGGTGGAEKHLLIVSEMPSHTHLQDAHNHAQTNHTHANTLTDNGHNHGYIINIQHGDGAVVTGESLISGLTLGGRRRYLDTTGNNNQTPMTINNAGQTANLSNATAVNQNAGGDVAHNNMQPYILTNYIIKT